MNPPRLQPPGLPEPTTSPLPRAATLEAEPSSPPRRSLLELFVDSFFHEANIRWMLVVGAAIVLASSLKLVSREWEHWHPTIKFIAILSYTAAIYGSSAFARKRLQLITTANVLDGLSLLLFPTSILSLSWLMQGKGASDVWRHAEVFGWMLPALGLTWVAGRAIFQRWFHGTQRTYLGCYLALAAAGAFPRFENPYIASLFFAAAWGLMTLGSLKVNRHIFWLTEEHRTPRVFGFLPIALLGLQFLALIGIKTTHAIHLEWFGFGCMLLASTVLLTTRSIADVFRQRTGNLLFPLPWHISLPLFCGVALIAIGVCLSFYGFSYAGVTTYAVVPTTAVASLLLFMTAKDTRSSVFTWIGLILASVAYQCTPTLASELVAQLKSGAASAIHEERLPIAFYGLTYIPWLLTLALASRMRAFRSLPEFRIPMQRFVTVVAMVLLVLCIMHVKAIFVVSLTQSLLFILFAWLFQDRRYILVTIGALLIAATSVVPFVNAMDWCSLGNVHMLTCAAVFACVCLLGQPMQRWIDAIPLTSTNIFFVDPSGKNRPILRSLGACLALALAGPWLAMELQHPSGLWTSQTLIPFGFLLSGLILTTLQSRSYWIGLFLAIFVAASGTLCLLYGRLDPVVLLKVHGVALAVSLIGYSIVKRFGSAQVDYANPLHSGFSRQLKLGMNARREKSNLWLDAFILPFSDVSLVVAIILIACLAFPQWLLDAIQLTPHQYGIIPTAIIGWLAIFAIYFRSPLAAASIPLLLPFWIGEWAMIGVAGWGTGSSFHLDYHAMALIWMGTSSLLAVALGSSNSLPGVAARKTAYVLLVLLSGILFFSLSYVDRLAIAIAMGTVAWCERSRFGRVSWSAMAILANIQIFLLAIALGGITSWIAQIGSAPFFALATTMLPMMSLSVVVWKFDWKWVDENLMQTWRGILRSATLCGVLLSLQVSPWNAAGLFSIGSSIAILMLVEFATAVQKQSQFRLWTGLGILVLFAHWLHLRHIVSVPTSVGQLLLVAIAFVLLLTRSKIEQIRSLSFASPSLRILELSLPAIAVLMAILRGIYFDGEASQAINTIALFGAAGLYFYRGVSAKQRRFIVAAGGIMNFSLLQTFWVMNCMDLQFYMVPVGLSLIGIVELLKRDLPKQSHNPIRYIGALVILVSPVFSILTGSWIHYLTLMALCVCIILMAIGMRLRALVYTGSAFLFADLAGMVVQSTLDHPAFLWVGGLALGVAVIALAAACENQRENILVRIRMLTAELATWN